MALNVFSLRKCLKVGIASTQIACATKGVLDLVMRYKLPGNPKKLNELDCTYFLKRKCSGDKQGISM